MSIATGFAPARGTRSSGPERESARLKFNPNHDATGRFAAHGAGGKKRPAPAKIRNAEHAELIEGQRGERKEEAGDIKAERQEQRETTHPQELKDREKEQARELKRFDKEQAKETRGFGREHERESRDLERDHTRELKEFEGGHARGEHDDADGVELRERHARERGELAETQRSELEQHHADQAGGRNRFQVDQADETAGLHEAHKNERKDLRDEHRQRVRDHVRGQRDEQAELLREHTRDNFEDDEASGKSLAVVRFKDMVDRGTPDDSGDDDEHGGSEENTYNLPEGRDIARELRRWVAIQKLAVLGSISTIGVELPDRLPVDLAHYDRPMGDAMTPLLSAYWHTSGKATMSRLGLDPDEWRVTNPHLKAKIRAAAYAFCESTNATTTKRIDVALADLHTSMEEGQAVEGETLEELTWRVGDIFTGLSKSHARTVAATEASRAVHAAQETSATEYGDVAGFELLLSADCCPLCRKIKDECPRVRAGQAFAIIGDNPDYSTIRYPPLHPGCKCTMIHVFNYEDGGPEDPEWGSTLQQPQKGLDGSETA